MCDTLLRYCGRYKAEVTALEKMCIVLGSFNLLFFKSSLRWTKLWQVPNFFEFRFLSPEEWKYKCLPPSVVRTFYDLKYLRHCLECGKCSSTISYCWFLCLTWSAARKMSVPWKIVLG